MKFDRHSIIIGSVACIMLGVAIAISVATLLGAPTDVTPATAVGALLIAFGALLCMAAAIRIGKENAR